MYKDPQLSAKAKQLRAELSLRGASITHVQASEIVAKMQGDRTLHVAQSKNNAPIDINTLAHQQASALMFDTLGRFEGNTLGLLASIKAAFDLEALGSRHIEDAVKAIFEGADNPKVSTFFEMHKYDELPELFNQMLFKLKVTIEANARAQQVKALPETGSVYESQVYDWKLAEGYSLSDLPEHHRQGFDMRVSRNAGYQIFVDLAPIGATTDQLNDDGLTQMSLFIEINEGRPCVHMSNSVYGDQVLTVFFTAGGLYLRPDTSDCCIRTGVPGTKDLLKLEEDLRAPYTELKLRNPSSNCAFIQTP